MLTKEILKSNTALSSLTDDQVSAITELSKNDEVSVMNNKINDKTAEIWNSVDADILAITGKAKASGVKTYDHLKTTLTGYKDKASSVATLEGQVSTLTTKNTSLEKAIEDGSTDGALKSQVKELGRKLTDSEGTIVSLRNDITSNETKHQEALTEEANKNVDLRFETTYSRAIAGMKFKSGIPQSAIDATINAAKMTTRSTGKEEFRKNDDGSESILFRDSKDMLITNPENLQKPTTASEVFTSQLADIIDGGRKQHGGGGSGGSGVVGSGGNGALLDFSNVTNRVQADRAIRDHLSSNDVAAGSQEFNDQYQEIYTENKVGDMPMQSK